MAFVFFERENWNMRIFCRFRFCGTVSPFECMFLKLSSKLSISWLISYQKYCTSIFGLMDGISIEILTDLLTEMFIDRFVDIFVEMFIDVFEAWRRRRGEREKGREGEREREGRREGRKERTYSLNLTAGTERWGVGNNIIYTADDAEICHSNPSRGNPVLCKTHQGLSQIYVQHVVKPSSMSLGRKVYSADKKHLIG